jgi:hypothetical protein
VCPSAFKARTVMMSPASVIDGQLPHYSQYGGTFPRSINEPSTSFPLGP